MCTHKVHSKHGTGVLINKSVLCNMLSNVCVLLSRAHQQLSMLQALRRRIDLLSKQKSDTKTSLAAAKSSCEGKADENGTLKAQIKVTLAHSTESPPVFSLIMYDAALAHFQKPNHTCSSSVFTSLTSLSKVQPDLLFFHSRVH